MQLEARMAEQMLDVALVPVKKLSTQMTSIAGRSEQTIAEMGAEKAGAAGDEDAFQLILLLPRAPRRAVLLCCRTIKIVDLPVHPAAG